MKWLVFSKNRAYQLDAFLRTAHVNGEISMSDITVLHRYDSEFEDSLMALQSEHAECHFIEEKHFRDQVIEWVKNTDDFLSFATDDAVFSRPVNSHLIKQLLNQNPNILTHSLRLGLHLERCYPTNSGQTVPNGQIFSGIFGWDSRGASGDWGYPLSVDGHVFRSSQMLDMLTSINFRNPNTLESNMQDIISRVSPFMTCFVKSSYFNIPLNIVQSEFSNRTGDVTVQDLDMKYRLGERLDPLKVQGYLNISAHQELQIA